MTTRSGLITKAAETLDEARRENDLGQRDTLTRVAQGYMALAELLPDSIAGVSQEN